MKGKLFAGFKGLFFSNRGFNDKRVRYFGVEPEHLGVLWGRGLKDIRVDTFLLQEAVIACLTFDYADNPFERISKATAKDCAFVIRKAYLFACVYRKPEFCHSKGFEHRSPCRNFGTTETTGKERNYFGTIRLSKVKSNKKTGGRLARRTSEGGVCEREPTPAPLPGVEFWLVEIERSG